jgi:hypothetical protein
MHKIILMATTLTLALHAAAQETDQHFSHTLTTTASLESLWKVWTDVARWKDWDKGLREATIKGPFEPGTKGKLIPDKGPKSTFRITEVVVNQTYTFKTRIPFGWLVIKRMAKAEQGLTKFTHEVQFTGPFSKYFGKKLGGRYRQMLPEVMQQVKSMAEQEENKQP